MLAPTATLARPTHEYLGMNAGTDFERRIVVKINAVERVRAELAPGKRAGDHLAMGTNTDPYQRCEAKFRLTRGIVGELVAVANPFSILTKSTLVLSDLELLAEAAGAPRCGSTSRSAPSTRTCGGRPNPALLIRRAGWRPWPASTTPTCPARTHPPPRQRGFEI
ncbi:MAG: SPL family radical SAM protein [Acidimicrobiales bacterium]